MTASAAVHRFRRAVGVQAGRLLATFRFSTAPSQRPLPRVTIAMGAWLPAAVLRCAVAVVALAGAALLHPGTATWVLAGLGALLLVLRPSGVASAVFAVALGLRWSLSSAEPFEGRSFGLLLAVHLLVALGRLSNVPWRARVDVRVLVSPARQFLVLQACSQLLALAGAALTSAAVTAMWVPVLGGAALTLLAWALLSRLSGAAPGGDTADRTGR